MNHSTVLITDSNTGIAQRRPLNPLHSPIPLPLGNTTLFCVHVSEPNYWELQVPTGAAPIEVCGLLTHRIQLIPGLKYKLGTFSIENSDARSGSTPATPQTPWYSRTPAGQTLIQELLNTSPSRLPIYLLGETGTGKEVLAKMIHEHSPQKNGPFVTLNCGAIPISLAESELFGHKKGAFTGASNPRTGALMQANHGTLFLDEVADLPLETQVKLLRFLENGEVRAVGSDHNQFSKVRIVSATHKPLKKLVEEGRFRADLYFRLAPITLQIPPLRERLDDFPNLIDQLLSMISPETKIRVSPTALQRLMSHLWPGNVRELRYTLERAVLGKPKNLEFLDESCFRFLFHPIEISSNFTEEHFNGPVIPLKVSEKIAIQKALRACQGNRTDAAKMLGIARSTLFEMLKRHKITGPKLVKKTPRPLVHWESTDSISTATAS